MATMDTPTTERRHLPERRSASYVLQGSRLSALDWLAMALLIIGGLNWAAVGLFNVDVIASLFGIQSPAARLSYVLVGLAALYSIYLSAKMASRR
jgi:uncharacterized membrane protein YuzA (DUF378 family)